jgi:hypothetical protein
MQSVLLLGRRRVLWGTVMAACLLSGFILTTPAKLLLRSAAASHGMRGLQSKLAASPDPQLRILSPGRGSSAQPRLAESYGKLPLSFEINQGQTDSQVKFLSRGSGHSLFLTGNEAVLALRKSNSNGKKQIAKGKSEFQRSPFDPPRALLERPANFQFSVSNFQTPATNDEPRTTSALLRMKLVGANPNPKIVGTDELPGKSNYFIGSDPKKWRTNVPNYAKVKYANVYPGVDLVYYGNQGKLEYDFVVQPGADPRQVALQIVAPPSSRHAAKMAALRVDRNGDLVVAIDGGEVIFHKPLVYQPATYKGLRTTNGGGRDLLEGQYVPRGDNRIGFQLAGYDRRRPVVIDPVLTYSSYLGGSEDDVGAGIAVDVLGSIYVVGYIKSSDFPSSAGAFQTTNGGNTDAFVTKLNAAGSALLYSTYLGGNQPDYGRSIAVDVSGNVYVTGTAGPYFPTTPGAFRTTWEGSNNVFVSKLRATGSALLYSTYLGEASVVAAVGGIAIDASDNAYVTGSTDSSDFPTTPNALQTSYAGGGFDGFMSKLNPLGSALVYSTYLGGSGPDFGTGIAVDASANAYVTGWTSSTDFPTTPGAFQAAPGGREDCFVSKLNATGSALLYSTYLGGSGEDRGSGIAVDATGSAYVTGFNFSVDFPTSSGALQTNFGGHSDAFVSKLNAAGSALLYSTFLGGTDFDSAFSIAVDASGDASVTGATSSWDFPTTVGAFQTRCAGGCAYDREDAFVSKLNATGSALLYSTYLGGSRDDSGHSMAIDAAGDVYITGRTDSSNFLTTPGAFQANHSDYYYLTRSGDAFVAKLSFADAAGIGSVPASLTFRRQAVSATSAPRTVSLIDAGSQPLSITSIIASGDFAQTNDCPATVQPAISCTLSVTFTPTAAGIRTGAITITDNAAGSPHQLPLTGVGGVPWVSLRPASLTFSSQAVGTTSPAQLATLKNTGSGPLTITSIATAGDFVETNDCPSTVQAGAACTLKVTFKPTATGTSSGSITIIDNAPGGPHQLSLTGTGFLGQNDVRLRPAYVSFQVLRTVGTSSLPQGVKLTNAGRVGLDITGITIAGPNARDFAQSNNCTPIVAAGASCLITVTFTPTRQGLRTASVSITDNAPGSPQTVPLAGRGTFLEWAPRSLNMGNQKVGTSSAARVVKLTNAGPTAITLYSIQIAGVNPGDFTQTNNCGSSLNPGASCIIQLTFTPTAVGGRIGHVAIRDSAFGGTHWVGLIGKGT